jgi:hypothetical protein
LRRSDIRASKANRFEALQSHHIKRTRNAPIQDSAGVVPG